ncbi:MAG TPA: uroporphyrinogen decarboxylase family protein [Phycisphaerae bacterium]|nr:uroporphyrinogen decarboxylase family protein [Phycisphaerae bacterium]HUT61822.1 uroporphyrinogen decarboxylase family protein [Phycisphaerae bacterium]
MSGCQRMEAAFSPEGAGDIPAVMCYEGIFIRDHWQQITDRPWWHLYSPDIDEQLEWTSQYLRRVNLDWCQVTAFLPRSERQATGIEVADDAVYLVNSRTGERRRLKPPRVGGWDPAGVSRAIRPGRLPETVQEVDQAIPTAMPFDAAAFAAEGRDGLARRKMSGPGKGLYPLAAATSAFNSLYWTWGFEGTMALVGERPDLARHACERVTDAAIQHVGLAAAIGAKAVWIEEMMTDMISPAAYERIVAPALRRQIQATRNAGIRSIYYFCGNPWPKLEQILSVGADALALEESKKDFKIDIEDVVKAVDGRCTVFGNLDAVGVLQDGSEEQLRAEIARQIAAGRANGSRFVTCLGSPVTPDTTVQRVRLYSDLAHELGRRR